MTRRALLTALLCTTLYVDRYPLDEFAHAEVRVKLCTHLGEPHVMVDNRTYERLLTATGYVYRQIGSADETPAPLEAWWQTVKDVRLYVTTDPGGTRDPAAPATSHP